LKRCVDVREEITLEVGNREKPGENFPLDTIGKMPCFTLRFSNGRTAIDFQAKWARSVRLLQAIFSTLAFGVS